MNVFWLVLVALILDCIRDVVSELTLASMLREVR